MPDRTNSRVGTHYDLWAIDPILGDFQKVGEGVKMSDGLIHTTSGGITTTDWSFFVPQPDQSGKGVDPSQSIRNDKPLCSCNQCSGGAPTNGNLAGIPANSVVNSMTGEFLESHQLIGYQSLGESRTLTLTYGSTRANPEQLFHIPFEDAIFGNPLGDVRTRFVAELWIQEGNFRHDLPGFIDAEGNDTGRHYWKVNAGVGEAVAKIDMREYATGYYDIGVRNGLMVTGLDGSINGSATEFSDKILNVNLVDSIFGAGWGLNGLQQIFENSDGSILIVDGNGTQQLFRPPLSVGGEYIGSGHDFSSMIRRPDGTFLRTLTDGTEMAFNEFNMLATITDSNNNTQTFNYDANGRLVGLTDASGLDTQFNYTGERISSIVDPFGRTTELIHDASGNLIGIKDPDGDTTQYDYNDKRLLTDITDKRDMTTQVFYNGAGRADREILRDGTEIRFDGLQAQGYLDYEQTLNPNLSPTIQPLFTGNIVVEGEDNFRVINYRDGNGNQVSQAIDHEGRYVASRDSISSNLNVISSRVYTDGLVTRTYDGRGNFTDYTYDDRGNILSISDSLSASSSSFINYFDIKDFGHPIPSLTNVLGSAASLVNLPFDFEFYGQTFNQIGVSNHGLLSFGGVNTTSSNINLTQAGAAAALANLPSIMPFWDGFQTAGNSFYTSRVYTATVGDEGSRRFIIQWQQAVNAGTGMCQRK